MSSKQPSHRAFVVTTVRGSDQKGYWHEVGVVFPHGKGNGFDLVIHEGISVHGRIVCTEPKKKDSNAPEQTEAE